MKTNIPKCIELYKQGRSCFEIGHALGITYSHAAAVVRKNLPNHKSFGRYSFDIRLQRFVMPEPNTGCWLWTGCILNSGYGQLGGMLAHRASYINYKGEIPKGLCVCHSCDVRSCVNPDHLFLGTHKENIVDMYRKSRSRSRVTKELLIKVRELRELGMYYKHIATQLGIKKNTVTSILSGKFKCLI